MIFQVILPLLPGIIIFGSVIWYDSKSAGRKKAKIKTKPDYGKIAALEIDCELVPVEEAPGNGEQERSKLEKPDIFVIESNKAIKRYEITIKPAGSQFYWEVKDGKRATYSSTRYNNTQKECRKSAEAWIENGMKLAPPKPEPVKYTYSKKSVPK